MTDAGLPRLRALHAAMGLGALAELFAVGAMAIVLHPLVSERRLWPWVGFMAGIAFARLALYLQARGAERIRADPARLHESRAATAESLVVAVSLAAGIGWGVLLGFAGGQLSGLVQGAIALVVALVAILASETLVASRRAMLMFAIPALGLTAVTLALRSTVASVAGGVLVMGFLAALLALFKRRHVRLLAMLSARADNERLSADLIVINEQLRLAQRDESLVFESALVGIAIVREHRVERCNRKLEEIFGYRRGTLQGASTRQLYRNEGEWSEAQEFILADLRNRGVHDAEREFLRRDKSELWCRYRGQAIDRDDPAGGAIWVFEDLTETKLAAEEMIRGEEQLAIADAETRSAGVRLGDAIESVPDAFALFDHDDRLINCNQRYVETFPGAPLRTELLGQTYEDLVVRAVTSGEPVPSEYKRDLPGWVARLMGHHRNAGGEDMVYQTSTGKWWQLRERPTTDAGVVLLRTDVTELKRMEEQARHLANHDPLTGLPNRRLLDDRMAQSFKLARRNAAQVGVMLIDLDHFKRVNDTKGHEAGDAVLKEVAKRLLAAVRQTDSVARHGGDEFVVVLTDLKRAMDAARIAQKIIAWLAKPIIEGRDSHEIGASIGIAIFPHDGSDSETLLSRADAAMYRAKAAGRNRYEFVMDGLQQQELEFDLN